MFVSIISQSFSVSFCIYYIEVYTRVFVTTLSFCPFTNTNLNNSHNMQTSTDF